jgi:hypothetical protein
MKTAAFIFCISRLLILIANDRMLSIALVTPAWRETLGKAKEAIYVVVRPRIDLGQCQRAVTGPRIWRLLTHEGAPCFGRLRFSAHRFLHRFPLRLGRARSRHDDILINVEAFRGAVRKGDWKVIKIALLPSKTQLFNLAKDPGETTDVAAENPETVKDLEGRLLAYAKEQKTLSLDQVAACFLSATRARR